MNWESRRRRTETDANILCMLLHNPRSNQYIRTDKRSITSFFTEMSVDANKPDIPGGAFARKMKRIRHCHTTSLQGKQ